MTDTRWLTWPRMLQSARSILPDLAAVALIIGAVVVMLPSMNARYRDWSAGREVNRRWAELTEEGAVLRGGSIPVVMFTDFQCPSCWQAFAILDTLSEPPLRVTLRHAPSATHPGAATLARAAVCAEGDVAERAIHRSLYTLGGIVNRAEVRDLVENVGASDVEGIMSCLDSARATSRLNQDMMLAASLGVTSTPTFAMKGRLVVGIPAQGMSQGLR